MKIAFFALNQNFCGSILEELESHHTVRNWKKQGYQPLDWANIKGLIDWCDLIYCDFIQEPCPEISQLQYLEKPLVVRMDGIDVMNHINMDWRRVSALVLMPVQEKRLAKLRRDWLAANPTKRLPPLPKRILRRNIGIDLDLFRTHTRAGPGYKIVLHSSVMRATKRIYTALQVFAELIERDDKPWQLTLIGTWKGGWNWNNRREYVMALSELVEQLDLGDRLVRKANMPRQAWAIDLRSYDIIWGPSFREGFPNSVGEAAASGVWPFINNFYGAELLYPEENICRSPIELMEKTIAWGKLTEDEKIAKSRGIRKHVEQYDRHETARLVRELCEEMAK